MKKETLIIIHDSIVFAIDALKRNNTLLNSNIESSLDKTLTAYKKIGLIKTYRFNLNNKIYDGIIMTDSILVDIWGTNDKDEQEQIKIKLNWDFQKNTKD